MGPGRHDRGAGVQIRQFNNIHLGGRKGAFSTFVHEVKHTTIGLYW